MDTVRSLSLGISAHQKLDLLASLVHLLGYESVAVFGDCFDGERGRGRGCGSWLWAHLSCAKRGNGTDVHEDVNLAMVWDLGKPSWRRLPCSGQSFVLPLVRPRAQRASVPAHRRYPIVRTRDQAPAPHGCSGDASARDP